ncbi:RNA-binding protein 28 [Cynoglossus semilaevis]|uniref:RNA-binding protein 28 n=1 Tax=Cynoglossus semilaevis TaxID=244447 RepID=A0A3P8UVW0_CYNSE|nr:RNA-binding protein 28 [Cynoglossus semilaevis]
MPATTLYIASLPATASNQRLEEIFSEVGPVKQCFVVREKGLEICRGFGYVTYSMEEDAQQALKTIKEYDGHRISLSLAKKKLKDTDKKKAPKENEQKPKGFRTNQLKAKLIIRNLSFKCSEDDLKEVFSKYGAVLETKIPLKPDGKMRGFAFVMFKTVYQASKALSAMNLKEIKGRQVAVDWAVAKDKYMAALQSVTPENKGVKDTAKQSDPETDDDEKQTQASPSTKTILNKPDKQHVKKIQTEDKDDSSEQHSEEEEDDDNEAGSSLGSDESPVESEDDENDEEEDEDNDDGESTQRKTPKKCLPSDVKEGRTIFIRNLSFDTEEDVLEEVLLQYGELNYIKVVLHPDTGHSKGCAFCQFKTKEAADKCIAVAQDEAENGGIRVDGRKLLIVAAVTREDATTLKVKKVKVETGTRNLYLAREGLIRAGTKVAEGVSESDMIKRTRFEEVKRAKLRDINVFVSKTRLCVHNLSKSVDNKKLKALCLQALKGLKGVRITECRVMYDKKPVKGQAMGRSLGYGFVQFQEHDHALRTLRHLNNNPDIFGSNKRPIVEFSLEDSRKLKLKEKRQQKNKEFSKKHLFKGESRSQNQTDESRKGPKKGGCKPQTTSELPGKEKVPPQDQKKGQHYSGFQTQPTVEFVDLQDGKKRKKVLPLPTHRGPKIRMRDKGKKQEAPSKKAKPGSKRMKKGWQMEKPTRPRNQKGTSANKHARSRGGDRFDSLVEQYKKKLMGNTGKSINLKKTKWFNS